MLDLQRSFIFSGTMLWEADDESFEQTAGHHAQPSNIIHCQTNKQRPTMLNHANIAFTPGMGIHTDDKASKQPHGKLTKQTESQEIGQSTSGQHK